MMEDDGFSTEYAVIRAFYGEQRARRSDVRYMQHIDEGLLVLRRIEASELAMRAYCLHPLVQADDELVRTWGRLKALGVAPRVWVLAMEYRSIANAYLSSRDVASVEEISLSPLADVNAMLVADKVQNYKDFLGHHAGSHPRAAALDVYFRRWLRRLGVSDEAFEAHCVALRQVSG